MCIYISHRYIPHKFIVVKIAYLCIAVDIDMFSMGNMSCFAAFGPSSPSYDEPTSVALAQSSVQHWGFPKYAEHGWFAHSE